MVVSKSNHHPDEVPAHSLDKFVVFLAFTTNRKMRLLTWAICFLVLLTGTGCQKKNSIESSLFVKASKRGKVSKKLEEASGLVASVANPGMMWTVNDSGNAPEVYLIDDKAAIVMTCVLDGVKNRDWEDIAIARDASGGLAYLYVGEIGDNEARYEYKYIYRLKEPSFKKEKEIIVDSIETYVIALPDGPRDMESMAIEPNTGDLYLISKREEKVTVYRVLSENFIAGDTIIPEPVAMLPYHNVVAADFSYDGKEFLAKTYDEIFYWSGLDSLSVPQALAKTPILLNYQPEPQGESIAWSLSGDGFFTLSESVDNENANLLFYKRR